MRSLLNGNFIKFKKKTILYFLILFFTSTAQVMALPSFDMIGDLDNQGGGVYGISSDGSTVVGFSNIGGGRKAIKWSGGTITDLGSFLNKNTAYGVSEDGSTIVGGSSIGNIISGSSAAFRWDSTTGIQSLGVQSTDAKGVTADGSVIVGGWRDPNDIVNGRENLDSEGFRWTLPGGIQNIASGVKEALGVSGDGSAIVGYTDSYEAFYYTDLGGLVTLGFGAYAKAISKDGSTVVGNTKGYKFDAFRWSTTESSQTGFILDRLFPGNQQCSALGVSGEGSIIVGYCKSLDTTPGNPEFPNAVYWDSDGKIYDLFDVLENNGLLIASDWSETQATGVTIVNGEIIIVGLGIFQYVPPNEKVYDGWIAKINVAKSNIIVGHEIGDSTVKIFDENGTLLNSFKAFGNNNSTGSVILNKGDVNGDGIDEIIVGQDGGSSFVRIFSETGVLLKTFLAFGTANTSGSVRVTTGDVDGDGKDEIIAGQVNGASFVRVFDENGVMSSSFQAFGAANTSGSVRLATGDLDGDGLDEIIVGQEGGDSWVRIFSENGTLIKSIQAFGSGNISGSVRITTGDVDGDGLADVIVGQELGTSFVRVYDIDGNLKSSFQAFGAANTSGSVRIATGDIDGGGTDEIIVGQENGQSFVKIFNGNGVLLQTFQAFGTGNTTGSVRVTTGDVDGDGLEEIIVGQEVGTSFLRVFDGFGTMTLNLDAFGAGNTSGSVRLTTGMEY